MQQSPKCIWQINNTFLGDNTGTQSTPRDVKITSSPSFAKCSLPVCRVILCTICQYLLRVHVTVSSRVVWQSGRAPHWEEWDAPSVTQSETRASHSVVGPLGVRRQSYSSLGELFWSMHVQRDTNDERKGSKSQEVGYCLYLQCCCTQATTTIPIKSHFTRDCSGADPSLWLHFTCFMVNKSSQDFGGLVST